MTFKTCLILASFVLTSACGISGPLEKAPPLWGADRAAYQVEQAKKEEERKASEAARAARNPTPAPSSAPKS